MYFNISICVEHNSPYSLLKSVTVLAKTHLVSTKTEFNFITTVYRHTQYLSIPSVSSVKC